MGPSRSGHQSLPEGPTLAIIGYSDDLASLFASINAEWIESMFALEATDRAVLNDPRRHIIDAGGLILFVSAPGLGIVGTCALRKQADGCFELTKMGVLETARGRKAGEYLLHAMLERARGLSMTTLYLLTNRRCAAAIHLYEKLGFVHDAAIMERFGGHYQRCDVAMSYPIAT
jgi:GNAT superfamily N-acetyltransferase